MTSWRELELEGATAYRVAGEVRLRAPAELRDRVREAVAERVEAMRRPVRLPLVVVGHCDACGGEMDGSASAGWCALCVVARRLALGSGEET